VVKPLFFDLIVMEVPGKASRRAAFRSFIVISTYALNQFHPVANCVV